MKPELLAPAGDLHKAKVALDFGADAVYVGGQSFSLRARASNFTVDEIAELVGYAHERGKKVYVTMNIIPRYFDLVNLEDYIMQLERANVDALIVSSRAIMDTALKISKIPVHLSTQMSVTNSGAANYYNSLGVSRVVLAREVTLEELILIKGRTEVELEVFIHGGMCSGYSGRCHLSNHMTDRDANRGGCAHSCRWNYQLLRRNHKPIKGNFNLGSKDMMVLPLIPKLVELGISSLKIEGRMKSVYYLATVIKAYRQAIDGSLDLTKLTEEIKKAENRPTCLGFYYGDTSDNQLYDDRNLEPTKEFVGIVLEVCDDSLVVEQRNHFEVGSVVEIFGPKSSVIGTVRKIVDPDGLSQLSAPHPQQIVTVYLTIPIPKEINKSDFLRKINKRK